MTHTGKTTVLEVSSDQNILEVAVEQGIDMPHDCDVSCALVRNMSLIDDDLLTACFSGARWGCA